METSRQGQTGFLEKMEPRVDAGTTKPVKMDKKTIDDAVGDLVVIKEDNMPPLQWPLGRIVTVHAGKDGAIRVVSIRTSAGECTRAIHRLAVLPLDTQRAPEEVTKGVRRSPRLCSNS